MKAVDLYDYLKGVDYPGRGILLGESEDGKSALIAYFIMGRSVNSRNRVFQTDGERLWTQAFDPSLLSDPSLVIYNALRTLGGTTIVTNGDQTDTVYDSLKAGKTFEDALRTRTFEPDPPIYTPRISGVVERGGEGPRYKLAILKATDHDPAYAQRQFFEYTPKAGLGHLLHTYRGDGDPVPSFEGEPVPVTLSGGLEELAGGIWEALNPENKVSLFVRAMDLETGEAKDVIVNKNSEE